MNDDEKKRRIEELYDEAMSKLDELEKKRKKVISAYKKKLEEEKIMSLRAELMN